MAKGGCYLLYQDEKVVYVGQAKSRTHFETRIETHRRDRSKWFDSYEFIPMRSRNLNKSEKYLIEQHQPKYNVVYGTAKSRKKSNRIFKLILAGLIRTNKIPDDPMINQYRPQIKKFFKNW